VVFEVESKRECAHYPTGAALAADIAVDARILTSVHRLFQRDTLPTAHSSNLLGNENQQCRRALRFEPISALLLKDSAHIRVSAAQHKRLSLHGPAIFGFFSKPTGLLYRSPVK
jgi:hypothetical protein